MATGIQRKQQIPRNNGSVSYGGVKMKASGKASRTGGESESVGGDRMEVMNVAARGKIVVAPFGLHAGKHKVVTLMEYDGRRALQGTKGRVLPASIRGLQPKPGVKLQVGGPGGAKHSPKPRKNDHGVVHNSITDCLSLLLRELDSATASEVERLKQSHAASAMSVNGLAWRPNLAFEQQSETDM
ncbi:hypothetical protein V6N13_015044 [Hibiscus sabdariffa]